MCIKGILALPRDVTPEVRHLRFAKGIPARYEAVRPLEHLEKVLSFARRRRRKQRRHAPFDVLPEQLLAFRKCCAHDVRDLGPLRIPCCRIPSLMRPTLTLSLLRLFHRNLDHRSPSL